MIGTVCEVGRSGPDARTIERMLPRDHLLHRVDRLLDPSERRPALAQHYTRRGRSSIYPELLIRMALIGRMVLTVFTGATEFERALTHQRGNSDRVAAKAQDVRFGRSRNISRPDRAWHPLGWWKDSYPWGGQAAQTPPCDPHRALTAPS